MRTVKDGVISARCRLICYCGESCVRVRADHDHSTVLTHSEPSVQLVVLDRSLTDEPGPGIWRASEMDFESNQTHRELISRRILTVALTMLCLLIVLARPPRIGARTLEATVGFVLTDKMSAAEQHEFEITLSVSQALRLSLRKGDLQIAVSIYDPHGVKTAEIVSDHFEVLDVAVFAGTTGTYRIEMISTEQQRAGNVELKIEELTVAKTSAPTIASAWSAFYVARRLRQDWREASLRRALVSYADATLSWKKAGDHQRAATALIEGGEVHFILGEYNQALSFYQEAATEGQRLGDRSLEFDALSRAVLMYSYLGDNDRAEHSLLRVLDYYARMREPRSYIQEWNYANALHRMGEVLYAKGNLTGALENFQESLKRFVQEGDRRGEARARLFMGYVYATIGEQTPALAEFKHAQTLAEAIGDQAAAAFAVTAIGAIYSRRSDWKAALELHRKAMQVFQTIGDTQSEAITLNGVGQAYYNQGDYEIALKSFGEAFKRFEANHSRDFAAATLYQIARVYKSIGDAKNALTYYELCVKASAAARKKRLEAYARNDIATLYSGQKTRAFRQYRKSLNLFSFIRDLRGQALTLNIIGDAHRLAGHHREALKSYQRALDLARKAEDRKVELATLYSLARLEFDLHHLREAQHYLENSISIIEDIRINVTSADLRTSYLAAVHDHYSFYIDVLMRLDREFPTQGFAASAFRMSESAHARSLLEILSEAKTDIKQGVDPRLDERRIDLERELKSKELYRNALMVDDRHHAEAEQLARELQQQTVEYRSLLEQIRESNPRLKELAKPKLLNIEEIQGLLDQDSSLLEYSLGQQRSYLWVVTRDSFERYELPARKAIEDLAREVYALLTTRAPKDGKIDAEYATRVAAADQQYPSKALELSRMLLGPAAARLPHRRLLIVVEGMLQYVPFDALPTPVADAAGDPLLLQHEVIVLPSFATLEATRREKPAASSSAVVAVLADPVFSFTDNRLRAGGSNDGVDVVNTLSRPRALTVLAGYNGGSDIPRLVHASEEADAIISVVPRGTYLKAEGFEASRARIADPEIGKYQILHLATHGLIDSEHPELSSVVFSLVDHEGRPVDGLMLLPEIYNLKLSSRLVVLSACDTAIGADVKGEGLISLTRGFMFAGAKTVVASLWRVDDRATAQLMGYFYAAMLQQGLPPGEALRAAKEKLRRDPHWQAPYYWAGFVLEGEYRETIKVESRHDLRLTYLAVLFGFATLCGLYLVIRRRRASSSDRATPRFI